MMHTTRWTKRAITTAAIGLGVLAIGLTVGAARAAAQAQPPAPEAAAAPGGPTALDSLSLRYRLIESYTVDPNAAGLEVITEYQVATRETIKIVRDQPQGTPERDQTIYDIIYTERPARIDHAAGVTDVIRRYESFRMRPARDLGRLKTPLLDQLTVWFREPPGEPPRAFSLTEGRPIREREYAAVVSQTFLPRLSQLFPATPKRVGDSWRISRNAAQALLGAQPQADGFDLTATLKDVRKGTPYTAVLAVSGTAQLDYESTAVNARLTFTFTPSRPAPAPDGGAQAAGAGAATDEAGVVEAHGRVAKIAMALARTSTLPEGDGRLQQTVTREMLLERRPAPGGSAPLTVPANPPDPDAPDSWITYDDPAGRFHFRHPQDLHFPPTGPISLDEIALIHDRPSGPDIIGVNIQPPVVDPARDRNVIDPDDHRRKLEEQWRKNKEVVLKGAQGWLPEADWAPLKRKVYRIEAALTQRGEAQSPRIYFDYYLVVFERNQSIVVTAMTTQDPHLAFRNQAEALIKSFQLGTSDGSPPVLLSPASSFRGADPSGGVRTPPAAASPTSPAAGSRSSPFEPRPAPRPEPETEPSPFPR